MALLTECTSHKETNKCRKVFLILNPLPVELDYWYIGNIHGRQVMRSE